MYDDQGILTLRYFVLLSFLLSVVINLLDVVVIVLLRC